jgi:asparagine synthase (glutamine-hydrolysing)
MCGICGFVERQPGRPPDRELLGRMNDVLSHRGPDGSGTFVDRAAALGHRRLSIVDLSDNGAQPMPNEDGTLHVTFNGEIYNFEELRKELLARGHTFRSRCDTEVLVHGYEQWGLELPKRLRGMFAFAIWDTKRRRLLLARDPLGIKPLYFHLGRDRFSFASEIKALLQDPAVPRDLDEEALDLYLSLRYVPGGQTAFEGIQKLPPAHFGVFESGKLLVQRYWSPFDASGRAPQGQTEEELQRELWAVIREKVQSHLMADVPLGIFLSGGTDSSAVAAHMVALRREAGGEPVKSFAVGYRSNDGSSELQQAHLVARALGTAHREVFVTAQDFVEFLPRLAWHLDEPVADPSCVPLYYLSKRAKEEVTVVLSGEGADEILGGYPIYRTMLLLEGLRRRLPHALDAAAPLLSSLIRSPKARKYLHWATLPLEQRYRGVSVAFTDEEKALLLGGRSGIGPRGLPRRLLERLSVHWRETAGLPPLERMLEIDRRVWLPDDLLVKADKMTMACALELRVPFLDRELVEWSARIEPSLKLRGRTGKYLLKQAAYELLPPECTTPVKKGFTTPLPGWLRGLLHQQMRDALLDRGSFARNRFGEKALQRLISAHREGRANRAEELWSLWVLELWMKAMKVRARPIAPVAELRRSKGTEMGHLRGRDIVCFSNDWDGDPLSKMHAMKLLARDNRVLWVNSIGNRRPTASARDLRRIRDKLLGAARGLQERHPNIWVLSPLALPFYGSELVRAANGAMLRAQVLRAMEKLGFKRPVSWSFLPSSAPVSGTLGEDLVVYHCVDEFSAFSDAPGAEIRELERRLLAKADVVICSSQKLVDDKMKWNPNTHLVQHGVDLQHFAKACDPQTPVAEELRGLPGPVIGFWGLIADWVDLQLIRHVADAFSGGTVVLLGQAVTDLSPLQGARNVRILGRRPYAALPGYAKAFEVALMPFRVNELTLAANPLKVREYLAAGLPVVSTPIPEVERLGLCRIGRDPDEVVQQISAAISAGAGPSRERAEQVRGQGWEARVEEMARIVSHALAGARRAA